MAFDMEYFDSIDPELIRGKFYRKVEIDALLKEIAARAELQNKEQELLKFKLEKAAGDLRGIDEAGDRARTLAQGIIEDAKELASRITADAQTKADIIIEKAQEEAKEIADEAQNIFDSVAIESEAKKDAFIEAINAAWRQFAGIAEDTEQDIDYDEVPDDIGFKLDRIARALDEIGPEDEE